MSRVILLLPSPDVLQLANCHKYVTRGAKTYDAIYTLTTIVGRCAGVEKILVIGHGKVGGFETATVDEVAQAIIDSGISLTGGKKIAFDTCYAGKSGAPGSDISSALHQVRVRLKKHDFDCNLTLTGATGCSITIGGTGAKRLVVDDDWIDDAGDLQNRRTQKWKVNLFAKRGDWSEALPSDTIKVMAHQEYSRLIGFANDFRSNVNPYLDTSEGRKITLQV